MDDAQAKRLRELAERATPGPWMRLFGERTVYDRMEDGCRGVPIACTDFSPPMPADAANLDYIAAASPDVLLALLDEREALRRERDSAREAQRTAETELAQQMARLTMRADEAVREKVLATQTAQRLAGERDAALALLRECREFMESAPMARDATLKKFPLCDRIDALLGDGREAR